MPTECSPGLFEFARVESRSVVASFDGGRLTSDAGALLLGATDRVLGLTRRLAACFHDARDRSLIEHEVGTLVMQRVVGIALGCEDLLDHDTLRHDAVLATPAGKPSARRCPDCAPLAGKSTLNRLELGRDEPSRHARPAADTAATGALFVDLFRDAHARPPRQATLDLDATDDPLHGSQAGRFFHGCTTATAPCRPACSSAVFYTRRASGAPTPAARPGRRTRPRASSGASAPAGRGGACRCAPTAASPARR